MSVATISVQELASLFEASDAVELIDVRTPTEFREIHVPTAQNVPLDTIKPDAFLQARSVPPDKPLYIICRSGARAAQACKMFQQAGFSNVVNVEGGTLAWNESNLTVKLGKKAISLERQVRIATGSLVVAGVALGYLVHPYFLGISALVGGGLVYSGITDSCLMGMMLAKMPWNQVSQEGASCGSR